MLVVRQIIFIIFFIIPTLCVYAQKKYVSPFPFGGVGVKFAMDYNNFYNAPLTPLTTGFFTTANLGIFYKYYYPNGLLEIGSNVIYKGLRNEFGFPLITKDMRDEDNIGLTGFEFDFKVGPKIWYFYPKFGFLLGYRTRNLNFYSLPNITYKINPVYAAIPMGVSAEFPTGFGSTGFGVYYEVGITDVMKDPDQTLPVTGRLRSWNFEIHVCFRTNK